MSDLLIKPLRAYEDRGTIRDVDHEPYAAPVWLAKELEQLKLCEIVGEVDDEKEEKTLGSCAVPGLKIQKKGQKWIVVDAEGKQVGDFIGKRDEAEAELAKRLAVLSPAAGDQPPADQPPADQPPTGQPNDNPPQE